MSRKFSGIFGQGATEYLVLLAVVLIIALVSIALLGFFPGLANDARLSQSKAYWQSASPIAIVDQVANYNIGQTDTEIMLTLQNNGGAPVELVAIGPFNGNLVGTATHSEYGTISATGKYQFFTSGWSSSDDTYYNYLGNTWESYIAPPKGAGVTSQSTQKTMLAPGERITVGFAAPIYDSSSGQNYIAKTCNPSQDPNGNFPKTSNFYEFKELNIFYVSYVEGGQKVLKKQTGTKPLVLPCTDQRIWR